MWLAGNVYAPSSPGNGAAAGIALIPEDRKEQSPVLFAFAPVRSNVTVPILRRISRGWLLGPRRQRDEARKITASVNVRMQSVEQPTMVTKLKVPPFVITLVTFTVAQGLSLAITSGTPINGIASLFGNLSSFYVVEIPRTRAVLRRRGRDRLVHPGTDLHRPADLRGRR